MLKHSKAYRWAWVVLAVSPSSAFAQFPAWQPPTQPAQPIQSGPTLNPTLSPTLGPPRNAPAARTAMTPWNWNNQEIVPPQNETVPAPMPEPVNNDPRWHRLEEPAHNGTAQHYPTTEVEQGPTETVQYGPHGWPVKNQHHDVIDEYTSPSSCGSDVDCGTSFCMPKRTGAFIQYDHLLWGVNAPDVQVIGDVAMEGNVTVGGNTYYRTNSMDTSFIDFTLSSGNRLDFGNIKGCRGWQMSVLHHSQAATTTQSGVNFLPMDPDGLMLGFEDGNGDDIDDDIDGDNIYGRNGQDLGTFDSTTSAFILPFDGDPDVGAPIDTGDMVNFLITFNSLRVVNQTRMNGLEFSDVHRLKQIGDKGHFDLFWGVRYLEFGDRFSGFGSGGFLDGTNWAADSDNDIVGPQIGARWALQKRFMRFSFEGRFLGGFNFQDNDFSGVVAPNANPGGRNAPVALEPTSFNYSYTNEEFSPTGEWRVESAFFINRYAAFRIGYNGMLIGGVSRAAPKVGYSLPAFEFNNTANSETVLVNGINIGFEINR